MALERLLAFCLLLYCSSLLNILASPVLSPRPINARRRDGNDRRMGLPEGTNPVQPSDTERRLELAESYLVRSQRARPEPPVQPNPTLIDRPQLARMMLKVAAWLDRLLRKNTILRAPAQQATGNSRDGGAAVASYDSDGHPQPLPEGDRYGDDVFAQRKLRTQPRRKCVTKRKIKTIISEGSFGQFGSQRRAFVDPSTGSFSRTGSDNPRWRSGQSARFVDPELAPAAAGSEHSDFDQVVIPDNPQETIVKVRRNRSIF